MDRTKNSPSSWATPPYWRGVSSRAMSTVATMLSPLATSPPMARGPAWNTPLTNESPCPAAPSPAGGASVG